MRWLLIILLALMAMTASFSGLTLLFDPEGSLLELDPELLSGTPFPDYTIPGFILAFIVGGCNLLAFWYQMLHHRLAYPVTIMAGLVMTGWILGQAILLEEYNGLQVFYFSTSLLIILLGWQWKGRGLL